MTTERDRHEAVIVDYGLGNLYSVKRALERVGTDVVISSERRVIEEADRLVLPGVGAFGDGMRHLRELDLVSPLNAYVASGRPVLGVCLGMQLLMSESEEFGIHKGLDVIAGRVVRLQSPAGSDRHKVPHIGWNSLHHPPGAPANPWEGTVLRKLDDGVFMYFLHSYVVVPEDPALCIALTRYGHDRFCSAIRQGNVSGVQFHPERSGEEGLAIYRSFIGEG